ncbi:MAG: tRNA (N(6)-L-threonylcarbamoyladenosine(37)-C(2))-methylthiotransferase [Nanoarchaeota archaeon]|nr:tRNA (N(6)-L-threonylcarbamoyladenosine(37)-C(2))-methylthiotransferase [Nanoarchaeota archaeon]MBU1321458.1 tRNA (N(6)-L-threonylcarbamoyladenosine(37)-C(2))-methylthiotransferase [Nanoarchaeota archaeon]MBU1596914.1 tRNA (N(6)-L-threonylcarbamoyladenosine(37)-C(2))-methylthiotransferase [Nanoarchaeota archaeon]MBU2441549.1 tRNA (N(6)-L-threonylcarbamoyladenosine(37)-C(2))-methylthiotransferase [Nanoarchaeota archaeon]
MKKLKIFIKTFGCTLNQSDSEVMAGFLVKAGHKMVDSVENADLVLFNTCIVKDNTEKKFFSELDKMNNINKKVVVAGCIPQSEQHDVRLKNVSLLGVKSLDKIVDVVEETAAGNIVRILKDSKNPRLNLPKVRKNNVVEIIPLNIGCLGACSYCKTRFARGQLMSYDIKAIKKQFENAVKDGVKEIWLTSQDTGAYGKDIGSNLPVLLKELLSIKGFKGVNDDYKIRLGMLNPDHALVFVDELAELFKHPNMFKFAHLPVQSGSNKILKLMNRKYKVEDFVRIVKILRKEIPDITIATDIISGFPGETEDDFEKTCRLLQELKIPVVNMTKFSPRQGTRAFKMKRVPTKTVKKRSKGLVNLQAKIITNNEWIGWKGKIIIDEIGKNNSMLGRNEFYKLVAIKNCKLKIGSIVEVKVKRVKQNYLEAELV